VAHALERVLTTLSTYTFQITDTSGFVNKDTLTEQITLYNNRQYQTGPELEFRFYPLQEAAALYLYQRDGLFRWFVTATVQSTGSATTSRPAASGAWATRSTSTAASSTTA